MSVRSPADTGVTLGQDKWGSGWGCGWESNSNVQESWRPTTHKGRQAEVTVSPIPHCPNRKAEVKGTPGIEHRGKPPLGVHMGGRGQGHREDNPGLSSESQLICWVRAKQGQEVQD